MKSTNSVEGVESIASLDVISPVVLAESNSHPNSSEVIYSFIHAIFNITITFLF